MRIVEINMTNFGSTGKIMLQIAEMVNSNHGSAICCVPSSRVNKKNKQENQVFIGTILTRQIHRYLARYTGFQDCFSIIATIRFLKHITKYKPDLIHLHNIHGNYINLPMLFHYIKKYNIPVIWTLHDCWSFTGQCPYFTMVKCSKWQTGCYECPQTNIYPSSYVDRTRTMWKLKKKWFEGVENLIIVTPSHWLANLVKKSYLKNYDVRVIHNGIDLKVFHPTFSDFREKYNIGMLKKIVLGVAFDWGEQKGLDIFIKLSQELDEEKYQIVLIGTDEIIDKGLPRNIISIHRTHNQTQLAEIYTVADIFVNPTREENYPTVNMEAIACGTPVITFNTGGSPESVEENTGLVIPCDDFELLKLSIKKICELEIFSERDCVESAVKFDKNKKYEAYIKLYESLIEDDG